MLLNWLSYLAMFIFCCKVVNKYFLVLQLVGSITSCSSGNDPALLPRTGEKDRRRAAEIEPM